MKSMKRINLLLSALFILFAYFQFNDPDPIRWIAMYGYIALLMLLAGFDKYYIPAIYLGLLASVAWMISLAPEFISWLQGGAESIVGSMKAEKPHIEFTREFLGLVVVILAFSFLLRQAKKIIG